MAGVAELMKLADRREPGPAPGFGREHVVLAFLILGASGAIGRQALAVTSDIGEGSIRTILKRFKEAGYVDVDPGGIRLTDAGRRAYRSVSGALMLPLMFAETNLTVGKAQAAVLVKSSSRKITSGIEQRDASIKSGADGATSFSYKGDRFAVPGGSADCEKDFPSASWATLRRELKPRNGDAIIVCGATNPTLARLGAIAASLTLL